VGKSNSTLESGIGFGVLEALLLGLTLATAILLIETVSAAREGVEYLASVRGEGALLEVAGTYALLFGSACLAGWLIAWLLGKGVARRPLAVLLGLSFSLVPIGWGALDIHPFVHSLLGIWQVPLLLGTLAIVLLTFAIRVARSGGARRHDLTMGFGLSLLLALTASAAAVLHENAVALLHGDPPAWLRVGGSALIAILLAIGLSFALRGLHARRSVLRLAASWAVLLSLCVLAPYGLTATAGSPFAAAEDPPSASPSVLLIVIDTLRADALSGAGAPPGTTPAIDTLARDGIVFDRAHSAAPWTLPSFGSILTSTYPSQNHAGFEDRATGRRLALSESLPTLAETLHAAGYATAAVLTNGYLSARYALGRGFDAYENLIGTGNYHPIYRWFRLALHLPVYPYVPAEPQEQRVASMLNRLEGAGKPFFLLAHFMDPHEPHIAPNVFYDRPAGERTVTDDYRAEVRYVDHAIGDLLQTLRASRAYDNLLIILTSDHGEELLEHRPRTAEMVGVSHGHTLYEELLHVPLIVKLPHAQLAGTHREELVSGIDLAPTILGALGIPVPSGFVGLDILGGQGRGIDLDNRVVLAEGLMVGAEMRAAMRGNRKVIRPAVAADGHADRAFDLARDPLERRPIADAGELAAFEGLRHSLLIFAGSEPKDRSAEAGIELSAEQIEQLKALGYVAGSKGLPSAASK
jgi:arylsulfatase A-like enzyme